MTETATPTAEPTYPDLFHAADQASQRAQKLNFTLIRGEYGLLIGTAIIALLGSVLPLPNGLYILLFLALAAVATLAHFLRLDQRWYHSRAMAESVKSVTWSYMMKAEPFETTDDAELKKAFSDRLKSILQNSKQLGAEIAPNATPQGQITDPMTAMRAKPVNERLKYYLDGRVSDQCDWYRAKSKFNKDRALYWYLGVVAVYVVPIILIGSTGTIFSVGSNWSFYSIFLLLGSCGLGWTKAKRYRELSASYALTAQEISILRTGADHITNDDELSDFVSSAERAFSREHTQWVARRS